MSFHDYVKQLEQVNNAIKSCSHEEREELLSLKSSIEELLALTCDDEPDSAQAQGNSENNIDVEYALFMAELSNNPSSSTSPELKHNEDSVTKLKSLEGKKCKAPHINKWGSKGYHNAMICSILDTNGDFSDIQVKVLFTNPTHEEMLPCPYYFDTDCKFSEDKCKYSHGEIVSLSELQDYTEPNFGSLKIGSGILAKQNNKLWGRARITGMFDNNCTVKFESTKKGIELPFEEILPLEGGDDQEEDDRHSSDEDIGVDQDVVNMSLLNVPSDGPLGDWEKFTTGIGSKLMQKMGYIVGTGLGKKSDGRLDPVTAVILPAGKSLDHCMNLREKCGGDKDLFNVEKKMKIRQKRQEIRNQKAYEIEQKKKDVFGFLNETLIVNTGHPLPSSSKSEHRKNIKNETCRNLNVASLKTDQDIRKTERDLYIIKESLTRHKDVKSHMHKSLKQKLNVTLDELSSLKAQAQNIKNEQNIRKDKRKLTIF